MQRFKDTDAAEATQRWLVLAEAAENDMLKTLNEIREARRNKSREIMLLENLHPYGKVVFRGENFIYLQAEDNNTASIATPNYMERTHPEKHIISVPFAALTKEDA